MDDMGGVGCNKCFECVTTIPLHTNKIFCDFLHSGECLEQTRIEYNAFICSTMTIKAMGLKASPFSAYTNIKYKGRVLR